MLPHIVIVNLGLWKWKLNISIVQLANIFVVNVSITINPFGDGNILTSVFSNWKKSLDDFILFFQKKTPSISYKILQMRRLCTNP